MAPISGDCDLKADELVEAVLDSNSKLVRKAARWGASDRRSVQALSDPRLLELPPRLAAETHLRLLALFSGGSNVSLWLGRGDTPLTRVLAIGGEVGRGDQTAAKLAALTREVVEKPRRVAVPILCWGVPYGALVVGSPRPHAGSEMALVLVCARSLAAIVQRDLLLERSAERERSLTEAGERRILRAGLDLHDGPVQALTVASLDLGLLRQQVRDLARDAQSTKLAEGRIDDVRAELDRALVELRAIASSLESPATATTPLVESLRVTVNVLSERLGVEADLRVSGQFDALSDSQRIAVMRIVQEAVSNVAEHSGAKTARITISNRRGVTTAEIRDDGKGFDVGRTLIRAARNGRLGLVGMSERARLLGGTLDVRSSNGGPTVVRLILPEWRPLSVNIVSEVAPAAVRSGAARPRARHAGRR